MSLRPLVGLTPAAAWLLAGIAVGAPPAWLAAGVPVLALAAGVRRPMPVEPTLEERALRRQLAVVRRRGEPAELLVAHTEGVTADVVRGALRISDFAVVTDDHAGGVAIRALVHEAAPDRRAVEARLRTSLGGRWWFAWARFPEDGPTYDALADHARSHLVAAPLSSSPTEGP